MATSSLSTPLTFARVSEMTDVLQRFFSDAKLVTLVRQLVDFLTDVVDKVNGLTSVESHMMDHLTLEAMLDERMLELSFELFSLLLRPGCSLEDIVCHAINEPRFMEMFARSPATKTILLSKYARILETLSDSHSVLKVLDDVTTGTAFLRVLEDSVDKRFAQPLISDLKQPEFVLDEDQFASLLFTDNEVLVVVKKLFMASDSPSLSGRISIRQFVRNPDVLSAMGQYCRYIKGTFHNETITEMLSLSTDSEIWVDFLQMLMSDEFLASVMDVVKPLVKVVVSKITEQATFKEFLRLLIVMVVIQSIVLMHKEVCDLMHGCKDDQVDSTVRTSCRWGLWRCASHLLQRKVSDSVRWWAAEQASERAEDSELSKYILPFSKDHISSILPVVLRRGLWLSVAEMLNIGLEERHRMKAIAEAVERADDVSLAGIVPHCSDEQLSAILMHTAMRGQWTTMAAIARRKVGTRESWKFVFEEASKEAPDSVLPDILLYCTGQQLDYACSQALSRGMWRTVHVLLTRGVSKPLYRMAVEKVTENPDHELVANILLYSPDDLLDSSLALAVEKDLWHIVSRLIERGVRKASYQNALDKAMGRARNDELTQILPHCPDDTLDSVLEFAITNSLWSVVSTLLKRKPTSEHTKLAIEEAATCATDKDLSDLVVVCEQAQVSSLFDDAVKKSFWHTMHQLLKGGLVQDEKRRATAVEEAMNRAAPCELANILQYCTDDQLEAVRSFAVMNGHWDVVASLLHRRGKFQWIVPRKLERQRGTPSFKQRPFTSEEQSVLTQMASEQAGDDDLYSIIPYCAADEIDDVLRRAVKRHLWRSVAILLRSSSDESQRQWVVEEVCEMSDHIPDSRLSEILPLCTSQQVDPCFKLAVEKGCWRTVLGFLKRGVDGNRRQWAVEAACRQANDDELADIVIYCTDLHLDSVLKQLLTNEKWLAVCALFRTKLEGESRESVITEATKSAKPDILADILAIASQAGLEKLFRFTVDHQHWRAVSELLSQGVDSALQRWAVEEASKTATDVDFMVYMLPFSAEDQRSSVLANLLRRGLWKSLIEMVRRGMGDTELEQTIESASRYSPDADFTHVVPFCPQRQRQSALEVAVRRNMWRSVVRFLQVGVDDDQRLWVVAEASKRATDSEFLILAPHCAKDQLDSVLKELIQRKMWQSVDWLLQNRVDDAQLMSKAVLQAVEHADDKGLLSILPHCPDDHVEIVLRKAADRGLWSSVDNLLQRTIDVQTDTTDTTVDPPSEGLAETEAVPPVCVEIDPEALKEVAKRNNFLAVNSLLKKGDSLPRQQQELVKKVMNDFFDDDATISSLKDCSYNTFVSALRNAAKFGRLKVVKYVCSVKVDVNYHVWAQCFVDLITHDHSELSPESPQEDTQKFKDLLLVQEYLLRCALAERRTDRGSFFCQWGERVKHVVSELDTAMSRVFPRYFTEYVAETSRRLPISLLAQSSSAHTREEAEYFLKRLLAIQPFGGLVQTLALQDMEPLEQLDVISHSSAARVWEEERRTLFQTAVEQKNWVVVNQMADHSLYDDQRGWALSEALKEQQWEVLISLAKHGVTEEQMMRVRRQVARNASWSLVKQLITQGEDVDAIRMELENAYSRRAGPPPQDEILRPELTDKDQARVTGQQLVKLKQRHEQIRLEENRIHEKRQNLATKQLQLKNRARFFDKSLEKCNWQALLYRLRNCRSSQRNGGCRDDFNQRKDGAKDEFRLTLKKATEEKAWHIVYQLLKLRRLKIAERDALFDKVVKEQEWGVARLLLESGVSVEKCQETKSELTEHRQWILLALIMETLPSDEKVAVIHKAISNRESSVIAVGLNCMEGTLSVTNKDVVFERALQLGLWQAVGRFVQEEDKGQGDRRDKVLHEAMTRRAWRLVDLCLHNKDEINIRPLDDQGVLHRLAKYGDWDSVEELLSRGSTQPLDAQGFSLLDRAIEGNNKDAAKMLIKYLADTNQLNPTGKTPMYQLIQHDHADVIDDALMWNAGVDVTQKAGGKSVLHAVCALGHCGAMGRMVARGADPLAVSTDGDSVLSLAVKNKRHSRQLVAECISLGVATYQPEITNNQLNKQRLKPQTLHQVTSRCQSVMEKAAEAGDVQLVKMLHESGACSPSQLQTSSELLRLKLENSKGHPDINMLETFSLMQTIAATPRCLKSMCRLVISHHIGVGKPRKRAARVRQLYLPDDLKKYVLFADAVSATSDK